MSIRWSRILLSTLAILAAVSLFGCGGSSGGSSSGAGGAVGKSPISGATVAARDADGNWYDVGTTTSTGAISFSGLSQLSSEDYPAVIRATGGTLANGSTFNGELRGVLETSSSQAYITPASTVVASLYDQGIDLTEAKNRVRAIVQNTLGYTGVDPLGNFLASNSAKQQNEVAQQSLLFTLGVTDAETNSSTMSDLLGTLTTTASSLASGSTFEEVAQSESGYDGTTSLAQFVSNNSAVINQIAADALQVSTTDLSIPAVDTTTEYPTAFVINGDDSDSFSANRHAVTASADTTSKFTVDGATGTTMYLGVGLRSSNPAGWTSAADSEFTLTKVPSVGTLTRWDDTAVAQGDTFNAASSDGQTGIASAPIFKYVIPASTTEQTVTFTFTSSGVSTGLAVVRTITVKIVDSSATVASSEFEWDGTKTIVGMTDSGTGTTLASGATGSIGVSDYSATVTILGSHTLTEVNDKYRVSFLAPDGFKFVVGSEQWPNYDQATLTDAGGGDFAAAVPTSVSLVSTAAKKFNPYTFTARLVDKSTSSVERSAGKSVYMVRSGSENQPAQIDNVSFDNGAGATTSVQLAVNGNNEIAFNSTTTFTGRVLTWSDLADDTTTGATAGNLTGNWYLLAGKAPATGTYGFGDTSGGDMYANYDASSVDSYSQPTVTVDMSNKYFTPNFGTDKTNQDIITLQYIDSSNGINVVSSGGVTIQSTP